MGGPRPERLAVNLAALAERGLATTTPPAHGHSVFNISSVTAADYLTGSQPDPKVVCSAHGTTVDVPMTIAAAAMMVQKLNDGQATLSRS